ncbi:MAG: DnaJ domain-containing protein [Gammaproteobacteria bacterium]
MHTPYEILDIAADASDTEIKQAYLQKVKDNPPDRDQARFQGIQKAYETVKDRKSRLNYDLFHLPEANFDALLDAALDTAAESPLNAEQFLELLSVSFDDKTVANLMAGAETL